jgi:aspartyl/asparaginyl beta-hydroxylase (cupin superfamily)
VYADLGYTVDVAPYLALSARTDLAPGSGGSRITPCGTVTLEDRACRAAIVALYPSSQLVAHVDPPIPGRRFHIPLVVNDGCWVFSGGHWQQLEVGRVYQMDPTVVHGAVNWGTERRLHLMVDTED